MGETSKIEWTDGTWNPVIGCAKVSPACTNCYAEEFARRRMRRPELWRTERHVTSASTWNLPEKLDRKAAKEGRRLRLFVASLSDVFEDHAVWNTEAPPGAPWARTIGVALRVVALRKLARLKHVDVLLLTKRPENVLRMVPPEWLDAWPAHVWVGTTVEDQQRADERLPHLLRVPAAVRFVSYEPALGPVDFAPWFEDQRHVCARCDGEGGGGEGPDVWDCPRCDGDGKVGDPARLSWVIAGGESGPKARPSHPDWFRSVAEQCSAAGVAFLFKQWGDWVPVHAFEDRRDGDVWLRNDGHQFGDWLPGDAEQQYLRSAVVRRVGKRNAGRVLDGVTHDGYPEAP